MNTTTLGSLTTALADTKPATEVQTAVLKKALDAEAEGAAALIQAATQSAQKTNPMHLGNNIDTFA